MKTIKSWLLGALLAALAVPSLAAPYAYIPNANGVSVIDIQTQARVADIALDGSPVGVAAGPGRRSIYVSNGVDKVWDIDSVSQAVVATFVVDRPSHIALQPGRALAFVTTIPAAPPPPVTVNFINTDSPVLAGATAFPASDNPPVFDSLGTRVFFPDGDAVLAMRLTEAPIAIYDVVRIPIPGASGVAGIAVHPSGTRLYAVVRGNPVPVNNVAVIDLVANAYLYSIPVGQRPGAIAINPDGTRLYVANELDNTVTLIDPVAAAVAAIPVGRQPVGIDITPNGDAVYVVNALDDTVSVIATDTLSVKNIAVGPSPRAPGRFIGGVAWVDPPGVLSGLWWNPSEPGWGLHLSHRRNTVFATWFTYDAAGAPHWYVASSCAMNPQLNCPTCVQNSACSGTLYDVTGPRFFQGGFFDTSAIRAVATGSLQLAFRDRDNATMTYSVGGKSGTARVTRNIFQTGTNPPFNDYTDLWWNPRESGWGLGVTQQFGVMFLAWFVYDDAGRPVWYSASNCVVNASGNGCTGTLYRTSGPAGPIAGVPFDPSKLKVTGVGTVTLSFTDPSTGLLNYTVDGVSSFKPLSRQIF